ncbi:MAG: hypothetical protein M1825_006342 [Sarcosagium campestre]|nr:MAG: hypothetical protein M1825_006342 [Sarcosagium campestre]
MKSTLSLPSWTVALSLIVGGQASEECILPSVARAFDYLPCHDCSWTQISALDQPVTSIKGPGAECADECTTTKYVAPFSAWVFDVTKTITVFVKGGSDADEFTQVPDLTSYEPGATVTVSKFFASPTVYIDVDIDLTIDVSIAPTTITFTSTVTSTSTTTETTRATETARVTVSGASQGPGASTTGAAPTSPAGINFRLFATADGTRLQGVPIGEDGSGSLVLGSAVVPTIFTIDEGPGNLLDVPTGNLVYYSPGGGLRRRQSSNSTNSGPLRYGPSAPTGSISAVFSVSGITLSFRSSSDSFSFYICTQTPSQDQLLVTTGSVPGDCFALRLTIIPILNPSSSSSLLPSNSSSTVSASSSNFASSSVSASGSAPVNSANGTVVPTSPILSSTGAGSSTGVASSTEDVASTSEAGASTSEAGASTSEAGASTSAAGASTSAAGASTSAAGASTSEAGASTTAGASSTAGASTTEAGASTTAASSTEAGASSTGTIVCPGDNDEEFTTTDGESYTVNCATNYNAFTNDLQQLFGGDVSECLEFCDNFNEIFVNGPSCRAVVLYQGICYLKSSHSYPVFDGIAQGAISNTATPSTREPVCPNNDGEFFNAQPNGEQFTLTCYADFNIDQNDIENFDSPENTYANCIDRCSAYNANNPFSETPCVAIFLNAETNICYLKSSFSLVYGNRNGFGAFIAPA